MESIYVVDTVAFINYFNDFFAEKSKISEDARNIIKKGLSEYYNIKLIIPSVVFLEIHIKFLISEELLSKFKYEIYNSIKESPDIEVKPIEKNVMKIFSQLDDSYIQLEHNDKIILSSAIDINSSLITIDPEIIKYANKYKCIPSVIS